MDRKKLVLLVAALVIAIGTAFIARSMFAGAAAPQAEAAVAVKQGPKVLVAQRALPPGTIITADALGFQSWPEEMVKDAYFIEGEADMKKLIGTVVRFGVTAGEPVTQGSLVSPQDRGFLAAALTPGMRAITVPVSAQSGVAGFIFPGDRVDMMLSQSVEGLNVTETILRNLRILATDQTTSQEPGADGKTQPRVSGSVTLEVSPRIAEKITVAQSLGSISFSLRPLSESNTGLEKAIASGQVKLPAGATKEQEEALLKQAVAQPVEGATSFSTGGDVSRFRSNRKTAPAPQAGAAPAPGAGGAPVYRGPVIRIRRGSGMSVEPVGKSGFNSSIAGGLQGAAGTVPSATAAMMIAG